MLLGAHQSAAGGLHLAFGRGRVDGCQAIQIFTKTSGMWREPTLTGEQVAAFRSALEEACVPVMAHTSYLINLATDQPEILARSKDALVAEVKRSSALGVSFCVLHPGAHLGAGEDVGVARIVASLDEVLERTRGESARIVIENTAGQGTCVGHRFEHIAEIFRGTKESSRLGVCFDTQHAFAAGYDLSTSDGYARTFEDFDAQIGLGRLCGFHLNDSKKALGSHVDRHEHIGEGVLGLPLFWRLANDPRFARIPAVLETEPKEGGEPYKDEVALLRGLVGAKEPPPKPFRLEVLEAPRSKSTRRARG